jgi:hydrogenase maturation protease
LIVIGVGNELRRDDGAGPAVVDALRSRSLRGATLTVSDGEPSRLIDLWTGADLAVVVDAVPSADEPGRVRELGAVRGAEPGTGSHDLGLGVATGLGETLGRMPATLRIYLIEGADFGFGTGLSPLVRRAVDEVADRITALSREVRR